MSSSCGAHLASALESSLCSPAGCRLLLLGLSCRKLAGCCPTGDNGRDSVFMTDMIFDTIAHFQFFLCTYLPKLELSSVQVQFIPLSTSSGSPSLQRRLCSACGDMLTANILAGSVRAEQSVITSCHSESSYAETSIKKKKNE